MRDGRVLFEPLVRFGNRFRFGLTQSVAILLRWNHRFQKMHHSGKLRRGQLVKQKMGVFSVSLHTLTSIHGRDWRRCATFRHVCGCLWSSLYRKAHTSRQKTPRRMRHP